MCRTHFLFSTMMGIKCEPIDLHSILWYRKKLILLKYLTIFEIYSVAPMEIFLREVINKSEQQYKKIFT